MPAWPFFWYFWCWALWGVRSLQNRPGQLRWLPHLHLYPAKQLLSGNVPEQSPGYSQYIPKLNSWDWPDWKIPVRTGCLDTENILSLGSPGTTEEQISTRTDSSEFQGEGDVGIHVRWPCVDQHMGEAWDVEVTAVQCPRSSGTWISQNT